MRVPGGLRLSRPVRFRAAPGPGVSSRGFRVPCVPGLPGPLPLLPLSPWLRCALPLWLPRPLLSRGLRFPWLPLPLLGFGLRPLLLSSRLPGPSRVLRPGLPARLPVPLPLLRPGLPVSRRGLPPWLRPLPPRGLPALPWRLPPPALPPVLPVFCLRLRPARPVCASRSWFSPLSPWFLLFSIIHRFSVFVKLRAFVFLGFRGFWVSEFCPVCRPGSGSWRIVHPLRMRAAYNRSYKPIFGKGFPGLRPRFRPGARAVAFGSRSGSPVRLVVGPFFLQDQKRKRGGSLSSCKEEISPPPPVRAGSDRPAGSQALYIFGPAHAMTPAFLL